MSPVEIDSNNAKYRITELDFGTLAYQRSSETVLAIHIFAHLLNCTTITNGGTFIL